MGMRNIYRVERSLMPIGRCNKNGYQSSSRNKGELVTYPYVPNLDNFLKISNISMRIVFPQKPQKTEVNYFMFSFFYMIAFHQQEWTPVPITSLILVR